MPHQARKKSGTGYYHVVPKGMHDQILFSSDADRQNYVDLLGKAKIENGILIHAYCLMDNHVHLVVEDTQDQLASFVKQVHEHYGMYFANKTGRQGGIFQRRYWSEPIDKESHLLSAVRYVHANPAVAGICPASIYEWSSAKDYLGRDGISDARTVLDMCGGLDGFIDFSRSSNWTAVPFPGSRLKRHLTDSEAAAIARTVLGTDGLLLGSEDAASRKQKLMTLYAQGFTISQLVRLTGLGRKEIEWHLEIKR